MLTSRDTACVTFSGDPLLRTAAGRPVSSSWIALAAAALCGTTFFSVLLAGTPLQWFSAAGRSAVARPVRSVAIPSDSVRTLRPPLDTIEAIHSHTVPAAIPFTQSLRLQMFFGTKLSIFAAFAAGAIGIVVAMARIVALSARPQNIAAQAVVGIAADRSVKLLIEKHCFVIAELARRIADVRDPEIHDNTWLMRFAVARSGDLDAAEKDIRDTIAWRNGEGRYIVEAAAKGIKAATSKGSDSWMNDPVMAAAPYSSVISKYITPSQIITISLQDTQGDPETNDNDLVYVIRAAAINDKALMSEITVEQCVQFFLYAKEVAFQVADQRTRQSGRLVTLITANDLRGINLFGDATFRKVLSEASKRAVTLYPLLAGPTLLLNLPRLLASLIKVFKPLFPKSVQEKLKFKQGPLRDVKDLRELLKPDVRDKFLTEIQAMLL